VEYFKYLGSIITNEVKRTREIKSSIAMAKAAFNLFTRKLDIWSIALYGTENWVIRKVDQK
jgi:hypothetical protein